MNKEEFNNWQKNADEWEKNFISFDEKTEELIGWDECTAYEIGRAKTITEIIKKLNWYACSLNEFKEGEWFLCQLF